MVIAFEFEIKKKEKVQEVFASIAYVDDTGIPKNPRSMLAIINIRFNSAGTTHRSGHPNAASMTKDYHGFH
jgi:hypothetical protein